MAFGNERTHILSTEGMINFAKESPKARFLVATEIGIIHRLDKEAPGKRFEPVHRARDLQVHEDDHAREAARLAARLEVRGDGRARDRRARARRDRAHGRDRLIFPRPLRFPLGARALALVGGPGSAASFFGCEWCG